jgi:hypothetical protein
VADLSGVPPAEILKFFFGGDARDFEIFFLRICFLADLSGVPGRPEDPDRQLYKFWERFHVRTVANVLLMCC